MIGIAFLSIGIILMAVSLFTLVSDLKHAHTSKDKWGIFLEFILDPFAGLTSLFYLGSLLLLFGILKVTGAL